MKHWMRAFLRAAAACVVLFGIGNVVAAQDAASNGDGTVDTAIIERAAELRDRALEDDLAYRFVSQLTTEVGHRFAGSDGDRRGVAWAWAKLEELGFENVRGEPVEVPRWIRGEAHGWIVAPFPQEVKLIALGGSVGTEHGGIEAEILQVDDLDALEALDAAQVEGKIVFIRQRMERTHDGTGYRNAVGKRVRGAAVAAERGAAAVLIRSVGTDNDRIGHTGTMRYAEDGRRIPAVALSNPDADTLERVVASGKPVRFRLDLTSRHLDPVMSANVIGEIVGREAPEEIVLLACHLDSWDVGTGAVDDGSGCGTVTAAAYLIGQLPQKPRRTIRVLLAANEEFGLSGARAYGEQHKDALAQHIAGVESDLGADNVITMRSKVSEETLPVVQQIAQLLEPLGVEYEGNTARGGADLRPLRENDVPLFDLQQDASRYFDLHHTDNDTLDKIDPEQHAQNVAAFVALAYVVADSEVDFRPVPSAEE